MVPLGHRPPAMVADRPGRLPVPAGFRSPYLADSPDVRSVLSAAGFRYDSSVGARGGSGRPWPAAIWDGFPFDCSVGGNKCSASESYPKLW